MRIPSVEMGEVLWISDERPVQGMPWFMTTKVGRPPLDTTGCTVVVRLKRRYPVRCHFSQMETSNKIKRKIAREVRQS